MRLGNTPTQHTLFWLERAKSFAFFIKFVENSEAAFDLTGCTVQLTVRQPARYGGAIVLGVAADLGVEAEGVAAFKLQAVDLDLDLGSYDFDVTLTNSVGYSIPVLKGEFVIGDNTDPATSNMYTDVGQDSVVVVDFGGGNEVSVTVDYSWDPTHEHTTADLVDFDPADYVTIAEGPTYFEIANAVGNHESDPDPHPQYLTQAEADALYTGDTALDAHIAAADPHPIYLTQAEADALYTGDTALGDHIAAPDPHPQYLTQAEGDALYSPTGALDQTAGDARYLQEEWTGVQPTGATNKRWIDPDGTNAQIGAHADLSGRDAADSHPISAITNLQSALDGKADATHSHSTLNGSRGFAWSFPSLLAGETSFPWYTSGAMKLIGSLHADAGEVLTDPCTANVEYWDGSQWLTVSAGATIAAGQQTASAPLLVTDVPAGSMRAVLTAGGSASPITVKDTSSLQTGSTTTLLSLPLPAGRENGDLLVAAVAINNNQSGALATPPAGWTLEATHVTNATEGLYRVTLFVYTCVYDSGAEPATDWSFSTNGTATGAIAAISGTTIRHSLGSEFAAAGAAQSSVLAGTTSQYPGLGIGIWAAWSGNGVVVPNGSWSLTGQTQVGLVHSYTDRVSASNEHVVIAWWNQSSGTSTGATLDTQLTSGTMSWANHGMVIEAAAVPEAKQVVVQVEGRSA